MSLVEREYQRLVDAMTPVQRMGRAAKLWLWSQQVIARRLVNELGPMSPEELKWQNLRHRYGHTSQLGGLIEERLNHVRSAVLS